MDDVSKARIEMDAFNASEVLGNPIVKQFLDDAKETCYNNMVNWNGDAVSDLVSCAHYARAVQDFQDRLEHAICAAKELQE